MSDDKTRFEKAFGFASPWQENRIPLVFVPKIFGTTPRQVQFPFNKRFTPWNLRLIGENLWFYSTGWREKSKENPTSSGYRWTTPGQERKQEKGRSELCSQRGFPTFATVCPRIRETGNEFQLLKNNISGLFMEGYYYSIPIRTNLLKMYVIRRLLYALEQLNLFKCWILIVFYWNLFTNINKASVY